MSQWNCYKRWDITDNFGVNWENVLRPGETITAFQAVKAPYDQANCSIMSVKDDGQKTIVVLAGGTPGKLARIDMKVSTSAGRSLVEPMSLPVLP